MTTNVPSDYTKEEIAEAIRSAVYLAGIAKVLNCKVSSIGDAIKADPDLRELLQEQRERVIDNAELELANAIKAGKGWAIRFALATIGRGRGYGQTVNIESVGNAGRVVVYMPDDGREQRVNGEGNPPPTGATNDSP